MTRTAALSWLQNRYGGLYVRARLQTTDTAEGFGPVLDDAWTMLGVAAGEEITQPALVNAPVVLAYQALVRAETELATRYDKTVGAIRMQTFQMWQAVNKMLDRARKDLAASGLRLPDGVVLYQPSYDVVELTPERTKTVRRGTGGWTEWG